MRAMKKSRQDLSREMDRQIDILYAASAVVWWMEYGWRTTRIMRRFQTSTEIWTECADYGVSKSMLQMLEEETGIEIALDGEKSYAEFDQLHYRTGTITAEEYIYSLHRRKRWVAPMIIACLSLALRRTDNWTDDQLAEFIAETDAIRKEYGENVKTYVDLMISETGFTPKVWGEDG